MKKWIIGGVLLAAVAVSFLREKGITSPPASERPITDIIRVTHIMTPLVLIMSKPNDGSSILHELHQRDTVAVTGHTENGWTLVRYGEHRQGEGFIITNDLTPAKYTHPRIVTGQFKASVMANPLDNSQWVATLSPGDSVGCLDSDFAGWTRIHLHNGAVGFVHSNQLRPKKP